MNYIYTNTRNNRKYVLEPMLTMGDKTCLVDMNTCENKFVSVKTLKRWYSKTTTEKLVVELLAFTGMKLGLFQAVIDDEGNTNVWTKANKLLIFGKHGEQRNANNPKFGNRATYAYSYEQSTLDWALS